VNSNEWISGVSVTKIVGGWDWEKGMLNCELCCGWCWNFSCCEWRNV